MAKDCANLCFEKLENELSQANDGYVIDYVNIDAWARMFNINTNDVVDHRAIYAHIYYRKRLKNGLFSKQEKKTKQVILFAYCPICGEKMEH